MRSVSYKLTLRQLGYTTPAPEGGFFLEIEMRHGSEVIGFMKDTLEAVGYDIENDGTGWVWSNGDAVSEQSFSMKEDAVIDAWSEASSFVHDILGGADSHELWEARWISMSVAQQGKMILLCSDDRDDDRAIVADGLFRTIRENDALRQTIGILGGAIESGDKNMASTIWAQAQQSHGILMQH